MKTTFILKSLIGAFFIFLAFGSDESEDVNLTNIDEAQEYLNEVGKYHIELPYGQCKFSLNGNTIKYWDNLGDGWTNKPKATCTFTLKESTMTKMSYSENRYVDVNVWKLDVNDECWDTDMDNILSMKVNTRGILFLRNGHEVANVAVKGWK